MTTELGLTVGAIVALLVLSGFFSGSETALTAASRARLRQMENAGDRFAGIAGRLIQDREHLIGALLLGNNLVNILAAALATSVFLTLFGQAGVAYATLVMTVVVLIFSEVLPKTLAIGDPDRFARVVAPVVRLVVMVFSPIVSAIQYFVGAILGLLGSTASRGKNALSATEEIRGQVELLAAEGKLVGGDRDRLGGLLKLGEMRVSDVMIHRSKMRALDASEPADRIIEQALASRLTRLPLWEGKPENIVGVIHVKDVFNAVHAADGDLSRINVKSIATEPWFVAGTTNLADQLNAFLKRRTHLALVIGEYGGIEGLVTLEDIIEQIVGEIVDEHDVEVEGIRIRPDGSVEADGPVAIGEINRRMGWALPTEHASTIAGLVLHEAGTVPEAGRKYDAHGFRFEVLGTDRQRVCAVHIAPLRHA